MPCLTSCSRRQYLPDVVQFAVEVDAGNFFDRELRSGETILPAVLWLARNCGSGDPLACAGEDMCLRPRLTLTALEQAYFCAVVKTMPRVSMPE